MLYRRVLEVMKLCMLCGRPTGDVPTLTSVLYVLFFPQPGAVISLLSGRLPLHELKVDCRSVRWINPEAFAAHLTVPAADS